MLGDYVSSLLLIILSNYLIILACDNHHCCVCQMVMFYFHCSIFTYELEFYCKKQLPFSIYLFIYLLISVWTHGYLVYAMGYKPLLSSLILSLKFYQIWPSGDLSGWLLCPLRYTLILFFGYFSFWPPKMFYAHLVLVLPGPRSSHFSPDGEWCLETKILEARCAHWYWGAMGVMPSQSAELGNTDTCFPTSVFLSQTWSLYWCNLFNLPAQGLLSSSLFLIGNSFLHQEETWFLFTTIMFTYLLSLRIQNTVE